MSDPFVLLERFEARTLEPRGFGHREHVQVAWAMLERNPFLTAAQRYASALQALADSAGAADKFNLTVTLAFLGLIAERRERTPERSWQGFIAANPDLLHKDLLARWYTPARLDSRLARRQFLLPDRASSV